MKIPYISFANTTHTNRHRGNHVTCHVNATCHVDAYNRSFFTSRKANAQERACACKSEANWLVKSRQGQQAVEMTNGHTTTYGQKNRAHTAHQEDADAVHWHTVPNEPQTTTPHTAGTRPWVASHECWKRGAEWVLECDWDWNVKKIVQQQQHYTHVIDTSLFKIIATWCTTML